MIARDKKLHFWVNFAGFAFVFVAVSVYLYVLSWLGFTRWQAWVSASMCGFLFAMGLSLGKEYGDKMAAGNEWSWGDLLADLLGMIAGWVACSAAFVVVIALRFQS